MEKKIVFASHNENKVREVREMLSPLGITVLSLSALGLKQTAEETADTFEGNSLIKAKDIAARCEIAVLSDDSGLSIEALDGFPGVHSARFMEGHSYVEKNKAILERLSGVSNRKAAFITAMTYISADRKIEKTFIGKDEGHILTAFPAGKQNGFGYDPLFFDPELGRTAAELSREEKMARSHRGRALARLLEELEKRRG